MITHLLKDTLCDPRALAMSGCSIPFAYDSFTNELFVNHSLDYVADTKGFHLEPLDFDALNFYAVTR